MPHPLPSHRRVASSAAIDSARSARARVTAATAAAGALLAGAALTLTPRAAHASDGLYETCLDTVHDLAVKCIDSSDNLLGDLACMWLGGVGYIGCAVIEAIRQLLPGLNIT